MTSVWTLSRSKSVFLQPIKSNEAFFTYFHFNRQVGTRLAAIFFFELPSRTGKFSKNRFDFAQFTTTLHGTGHSAHGVV